jgi:hypothetical protein
MIAINMQVIFWVLLLDTFENKFGFLQSMIRVYTL